MWKQIELPKYIAERIIGYSIPINDKVLIITYEGILTLDLSMPTNIHRDDRFPEGINIFDDTKMVLDYEGKCYKIIGVHGGERIIENSLKDTFNVDNEKQTLLVRDANNEVIFEFKYDDFSEDWVVATFSDNGEFLLLGMAYDFFAFKYYKNS